MLLQFYHDIFKIQGKNLILHHVPDGNPLHSELQTDYFNPQYLCPINATFDKNSLF